MKYRDLLIWLREEEEENPGFLDKPCRIFCDKTKTWEYVDAIAIRPTIGNPLGEPFIVINEPEYNGN